VDNGTAKDGVVVLVLNGTTVMAAYIRAADSYTLRGIGDGEYDLYYSSSMEWNGEKFTVTPGYEKFDDPLPFTTGTTSYTTWSITLHGVVGGTASTDDVSEGEFPDIGN
jgi:hypothetical protein